MNSAADLEHDDDDDDSDEDDSGNYGADNRFWREADDELRLDLQKGKHPEEWGWLSYRALTSLTPSETEKWILHFMILVLHNNFGKSTAVHCIVLLVSVICF